MAKIKEKIYTTKKGYTLVLTSEAYTFVSKPVNKHYKSEEERLKDENGCHIFPTKKNHGEKIAKIRHNGKTLIARRESYRLFYGELPNDWQVKNFCGNQVCFNPRHLHGVPPVGFPEKRLRKSIVSQSQEIAI